MLWAAVAPRASASTIVYQTDAQLIALSTRVVHARAVAQRTVLGPNQASIYTVTTLSVIEDFTGYPGDTIEVWELGGAIGNRVLFVGGAVEYQSGQEVLVCLRQGPLGWRSVAMGFSKFDVVRRADGVSELRRNAGDALILGGAAPLVERSLDEFRRLTAQVTGRVSRRAETADVITVAQPFTKLVGEPGWRWREADMRVPITYYRNTNAPAPLQSGADGVAEIQTALAAWTNPPSGSIMLQYGGTALENDPKAAWTGIPQRSVLISFEDPEDEIFAPVLAIGGGSASPGTGGTVGGVTYDGFLSGFVILQNAVDLAVSYRQAPNFTRILTHEVGHTIGFGHTQQDGTVPTPSANIMYATCCFAETPVPPALGTDDLLGLRTVYPQPALSGPTMALDRTSLRFGAVTAGATFVAKTSAQTVRLTQSGAGTVMWTATPTQPRLEVTPASGTGAAVLSISIVAAGQFPASGTLEGAISFSFSGSSNSPGPVSIRLTLAPNGMSSVPFGVIDTPAQSSTGVTGAVPFTGWALDDIEIDRVTICRAAVTGETAPADPNCAGNTQIFVGTSVFIEGSRPDVQAAFPAFPRNYNAGWGFLVLTNTLPNQGNGNYTFFAYAHDRDAHVTPLGSRAMACDNANATLPFGTIDTPGQGDTISGSSYVNFGWVLTQNPKMMPINGSTISVQIDGTNVGTVSYNHPRSDIAAIFPGYANSPTPALCATCNGPVGFRVIDTTALSNGLHTIVWTATDSAGFTGGLGSRFFRVSNGSGASTGTATAAAEALSAPLDVTRLDAVDIDRSSVLGRRGWADDAAWRSHGSSAAGRIVMRGEEIDRFELRLGAALRPGERYSGYTRAGEELNPLPVGSNLNAATGEFVWSPGVGFVGVYDLEFVRWAADEPVARQPVRIIIGPKGSNRVGPQIVIDVPGSQQDVAQPFLLAGWAIDPTAVEGTGIGPLHVWAYPLQGGPPVFLGVPTMGGVRPDVAAVHGDQFRAAGFGLTAHGLAPGNYDVAVFAWTMEAQDFNAVKVVRITVR